MNEIIIPIYYYTNKSTKETLLDEVSIRKAFEEKLKKLKKEMK